MREVERAPTGLTPRRKFEIAFIVAMGVLGASIASFNFAAGLGFVAGLLITAAGTGCWYLIAREEREGKL